MSHGSIRKIQQRFGLLALIAALGFTAVAYSQDVVREDVEGIVNFARIETTVACAGAIRPESVARIKEMGYQSIINLRQASEEGANIDAEAAAAAAAGITFVHLPFGGPELDDSVPQKFLDAITTPGMEPAFIHCAGGGRAATMWFFKRVIVDGWDEQRAMEEATALGLSPDSRLREFAVNYLAARNN